MSAADEPTAFERWLDAVVEHSIRAEVMSNEQILRDYLEKRIRSRFSNSTTAALGTGANVGQLAHAAVDVFCELAQELTLAPMSEVLKR